MISLAEENYLKAIFSLSQSDELKASTNAIAERLSTKASSVSDMLRKLKQKGLIHYEKYQAVELSPEGEKIAIAIIRKHRLWEHFLVEKLNFGWDEVHDIAEQLEHINSPKLTDELDRFLGFPSFDPHGDPIPNKNGVFPTRFSKTLDQLAISSTAIITGVKDHRPSFLNFLEEINIKLGVEVNIISKREFDGSLEIKINSNTVNISKEVSANLFIQ